MFLFDNAQLTIIVIVVGVFVAVIALLLLYVKAFKKTRLGETYWTKSVILHFSHNTRKCLY
jgi:hypothetical protein